MRYKKILFTILLFGLSYQSCYAMEDKDKKSEQNARTIKLIHDFEKIVERMEEVEPSKTIEENDYSTLHKLVLLKSTKQLTRSSFKKICQLKEMEFYELKDRSPTPPERDSVPLRKVKSDHGSLTKKHRKRKKKRNSVADLRRVIKRKKRKGSRK